MEEKEFLKPPKYKTYVCIIDAEHKTFLKTLLLKVSVVFSRFSI